MLRALGHEVIVSGYDLTELDPGATSVDVIVVEAREHLETGRQAIQRLRERPELLAARRPHLPRSGAPGGRALRGDRGG